ncbi:hypothetical protein KJ885_03530 [Patescibacteria group bacterium]|nr:hypothetical protein [Patescibacteria group bacterium]
MAKNFDAIKKWVEKNRPDLMQQLSPIFDGTAQRKTTDAFILLLSVGFEAGRQFQIDNPDAPSGKNSPLAYI